MRKLFSPMLRCIEAFRGEEKYSREASSSELERFLECLWTQPFDTFPRGVEDSNIFSDRNKVKLELDKKSEWWYKRQLYVSLLSHLLKQRCKQGSIVHIGIIRVKITGHHEVD